MPKNFDPFDLSQITVILDMDDVLFDFGNGFADTFASVYPDRKILSFEERDTFNMFRLEDAEHHDQIRAVIDEAGFFGTLKPIEGAIETMLELHKRGADTVIASSPWRANPTCIDDKLNALDTHAGPGWSDRAIFTKDKTRVRGTYLFDDKPEVVGALAPQWEHIYVNQPYNRNNTGRRRVAKLSDAIPLILADLAKGTR